MKWFFGVLGLGIVSGLWRLYWPLGYLALLIYAYWLVRQFPRYRRYLTLAYAVFAITLLCSTALHTLLMRNQPFQDWVQSSRVLDLLAGGPYRLAIWATLAGLAIGALVVWVALQLIVGVSSEFVLKLNTGLGLSAGEAQRYLWNLVLDRQGPSITVDNGQVVAESPPGILGRSGGPGLVIVRPGNAVILEALTGDSQVLGPGTGTARPFEKVKQVVDLRPQTKAVRIKDATTRDGIPLTFHTSLAFQIEPKADTDSRPDAFLQGRRFEHTIGGAYPVYPESVLRAVYGASQEGWQQDTVNALEMELRDVVAEHDLDALFRAPEGTPTPISLPELGQEVQRRLAKKAIAWGVKVNKVEIGRVEVPPDIWRIALTGWQKKWENAIALTESDRLSLEADNKLQVLERILVLMNKYAPDLPLEKVAPFLLPYATASKAELAAPAQDKKSPGASTTEAQPAQGQQPPGLEPGVARFQEGPDGQAEIEVKPGSPVEAHEPPIEEG